MNLASVTLDDKYTLESGRIYLSGIQALVRLPMMQRNRDRAQGLTTGGFISGYRGSPLGGYDYALWQARRHLAEHGIHFQPGLNEDLAATSVWGSQQVALFPGAKVQGAFGIWYGKGPGVDRSMDVLKHANAAGSARHGGVLCIAGDDHGCQSSTTAHQSEQNFLAAMIPVINPATVQVRRPQQHPAIPRRHGHRDGGWRQWHNVGQCRQRWRRVRWRRRHRIDNRFSHLVWRPRRSDQLSRLDRRRAGCLR